ncbi:thioredoxin family protein [Spirosoma sp. SC4-14]|uniref:thioredoxin family protein n=1 Tax=Spirosoma sp. SC4-14 TaxID=3128900 RepID=UPI0030D0A37C
MEFQAQHPILVPARTAVLLVFLPSAASRDTIGQRLSLTKLVGSWQQELGHTVRVLKIDENVHPDVVRSFDVQQFPAVVLVQQGVELWRQEGITTAEAERTLMPNLLERIGNH